MKISKPLYNKLNKIISTYVLDNLLIVESHKKLKLGSNKEVRFIWDLFWVSKAWIKLRDDIKNENLNDDHLETALLKINRNLELLKGVN